ncbi:30S ribosomal protein S3 [Candidatus Woesearchaeota archaeon]|nr:MAG: 30S ribosomal protein S3 [Candidatus Woesearchaeota archaeon]
MIERKFISDKLKEFQVQEYLTENLKNVGHSNTKIQKSPLGDKVIITASRPGLIIGRQGANIKTLTKTLKNKFKLENPQIEINEVEKPNLDAQIVAEGIAGNLERYGSQRFKGIGHKVMTDVLRDGAIGVEILISGKIPSSRAKTWRFYAGYLKKCGNIALTDVKTSYASAQLKTGTVGIIVKIMPANIRLPYDIRLIGEEAAEELEETSEVTVEEPIVVEEETTTEEFEAEKEAVEKKAVTEEPKTEATEEKAAPKKKAVKKKAPAKKAKTEEKAEEVAEK